MMSYCATTDKTAPRRPNSWFDAILDAARSQIDSKKGKFFLLEGILKLLLDY